MSLNIDTLLADLEQHQFEKKASVKPAEELGVSDEVKKVLTKQAGLNVTDAAMSQGEALARKMLEKSANEIIQNDAVMQAEQAATAQPAPEGDAEGVLQGLVSTALGQGATTEDRVDPQVDESPAPVAATQEEEMAKQASEQGALLAEALLMKVAEQLGEAPVVNNIQADQALTVAQKEQVIAPAPEGTANQILQAIVANAQATGAGSDNALDAVVAQEGAAQTAEPAELTAGDEVEKAAAVSALVGEGIDFADAVELVKQAEFELMAEASDEFEKAAAVSALVGEGIGFGDAVELVKQAEQEMLKEAGIADLAGRAAKAVRGAGARVGDFAETAAIKGMYAGDKVKALASQAADSAKDIKFGIKGREESFIRQGVRGLAGNRLVQGGAAGVALGGAGYAAKRYQEKKAAFDALVDAGVDYEEAAVLVKQAEAQVYGE